MARRSSSSFSSLVAGCVVAVICFLAVAEGHSWLACSDYRGAKDTYEPSKCFGFPRNYKNFAGSLFGEDRGFNFQGDETRTCMDNPSSPLSSAYTDNFPMAKYSPGQTVCLGWPAKNHVAATCTNQYIPDTSLKIFVNPTAGARSNPSQSQYRLVADLSGHQDGVIDFKGFQNCPRFCENMDKALCTQCFTVPDNLQVGSTYSFQWYWVFNKGSAPYTSCWEAQIVSSGNTPSPSPSPTPSPSPSPTPSPAPTPSPTPSPTPTPSGIDIVVKVTARVKTSQSNFNVQTFVTNVANLLNIPYSAIRQVEVNLDLSTATTTVITFTIVSVDGLDPVQVARQLQNLVQSSDPALASNGLAGMELENVNYPTSGTNSDEMSAAVHSFAFSSVFFLAMNALAAQYLF